MLTAELLLKLVKEEVWNAYRHEHCAVGILNVREQKVKFFRVGI